MRGIAFASCILAAGCSPQVENEGGRDSGVVDGEPAVDVRPFDSSHRGLVQGLRVGTLSGVFSAGFYKVPVGGGCTYAFSGSCYLANCENAVLEPVSAGTLTITAGASTIVMMPNTMTVTYSSMTLDLPPGTTVSVTASGGQVDPFQSQALVMPSPLAVTAPASMATVPRTQPLTVTWTPAAGDAYITLTQGGGGPGFPNSSARNIRCVVPAMAGTVTLPTDLLGPYMMGNASLTVAGLVDDKKPLGSYDVTIRLLAADMTRAVMLQ